MVNEALVTLSDKSLITLDDGGQRKYKITQKGLKMLELHKQIQDGLSKTSSNFK
jgi:predicted transcriptional regulator